MNAQAARKICGLRKIQYSAICALLFTGLLVTSSSNTWSDDSANNASVASSDSAPSFDRPAFGFGTTALPLGGFAIEQGLPTWSLDNQQGVHSSLFMTDSLLRLGLGNNLELQFGSTPFNHLDVRAMGVSQMSTGRGDSILGLKITPPTGNAQWAWGVLATVEFPDGAENIRVPEREYTLGTTAAQQIDDQSSFGYFAQWQRLGNLGTYQAAFNYGYNLSKAWNVYTETVVLHQQAQTGDLVGVGMAYLSTARLQWDLSFDRLVVGAGPAWMAGFGVSYYFGP